MSLWLVPVFVLALQLASVRTQEVLTPIDRSVSESINKTRLYVVKSDLNSNPINFTSSTRPRYVTAIPRLPPAPTHSVLKVSTHSREDADDRSPSDNVPLQLPRQTFTPVQPESNSNSSLFHVNPLLSPPDPGTMYPFNHTSFTTYPSSTSPPPHRHGSTSRPRYLTDFQHPSHQHPCLRECVQGAPPMTCRYRFEVEWYHTMSKACHNCPLNVTDCDRPDCILGDGFRRAVIVVNRQFPGPNVEVCQGDRIIVDLVNEMGEESTSIHWHGQHQRGSPYMDGVPFVTQCPVPPRTTFRYRFDAGTPGTHFWHSHSGSQRADGVFGSLIVRQALTVDPHRVLFDRDLPEHTVQIIDWGHELGIVKFLEHHHAAGDNKPKTLLVNGRGRFYNLTMQKSDYSPAAKFTVERGYRYRFRLINAGFLNCPIQLSVDNHTLMIIASDGSNLQPVEADSLVSYAGERFDFIINARQEVDNYWMRFRGLMDCDERFKSAHQVAVLHYSGASDNEEPREEVNYEAGRRYGLTVNDLNARLDDYSLSMPELTAVGDDDESLKPIADVTHYISYDFYSLDHPVFHRAPKYGFLQVPQPKQRVYTPQFNHITMQIPSAPPLSQPEDLDPSSLCNERTVGNCTGRFCQCTHLLHIPLGAVVELVLIDKGVTYDANHPFHLHGNAFRVVAMDRVGSSTTVEAIKALDKAGRITRKLHGAPVKDTVTVPDGGYTIIRFHANNPGFWLFHCHIEFHVEVGMALLLQVGNPSDFPPVPHGFPRCGNYIPTDDDDESEIEVVQLGHVDGNDVRESNLISSLTAIGEQTPGEAVNGSSIPKDTSRLKLLAFVCFMFLLIRQEWL